MNKLLLEALEAYYKGNIKKAEANLNIYLRNPMGIGEHADIIEAMDSQVAVIADNVDKLAIITSYQNSRKNMEFII